MIDFEYYETVIATQDDPDILKAELKDLIKEIKERVTAENRIKSLEKVVDIQCSDGNWNYDAYMHGMANGLILALAIMKNKKPEFFAAPKKWIADKGEIKDVHSQPF